MALPRRRQRTVHLQFGEDVRAVSLEELHQPAAPEGAQRFDAALNGLLEFRQAFMERTDGGGVDDATLDEILEAVHEH